MATKDANGPSWGAMPMSIPFICPTATTRMRRRARVSPSLRLSSSERS
jgi:hypothetical protein